MRGRLRSTDRSFPIHQSDQTTTCPVLSSDPKISYLCCPGIAIPTIGILAMRWVDIPPRDREEEAWREERAMFSRTKRLASFQPSWIQPSSMRVESPQSCISKGLGSRPPQQQPLLLQPLAMSQGNNVLCFVVSLWSIGMCFVLFEFSMHSLQK